MMKCYNCRNDKIFKYLSLLAISLILTSLIVSFAEAQDTGTSGGVEITFGLEPEKVRPGKTIHFNWMIIHRPRSEGEYCLELKDPDGRVKFKRKYPILSDEKLRGGDKWEAEEPIGKYTATLTFPCESPRATSIVHPIVTKTLLIIQKLNDTNRNNETDYWLDERLGNWNFGVTYPDGTFESIPTDNRGEIRIEVPEKYEGKVYTIEEEFWQDWKPIKKDTNAPIIEEGDSWIKIRVEKDKESKVTFLNTPISKGMLLIHKFNDSNQNQVPDYGEEGLANWEFKVAQDGRTVATCTTNETGLCVHTLQSGIYEITEVRKEGWIATTPTTQVKKVEAGQKIEAKFGNRPTPPVIVSKFYDLNRNGIRDGNETGIADWEFIVTQNGRRVATGRTDSNGMWMPNLPDGEYTINEGEPPSSCWRNSTQTSQEVTVKTGIPLNVEFGNYEVGTLHIYKFNDTNHNGESNDGELPLPNWGFRIKDPNGGIDITRYTADDGSIKVELPANVRYSVTDTLLVGWNNSTPLMQYADIKPCEDTWLTFGNYNITPIVIHKFNDTNRNGARDRGEEGLAGWEFEITGPSVDKKITNNKGDAIFRDVIPGHYKIEERMSKAQHEEGWNATTPLIRVEVKEGQKVTVEFGNHLFGDLCVEYGIYVPPPSEDVSCWHNKSDNLNVTKCLDPCIVHCDNPNPNAGEIINVTLRVCVFPVMAPTDIVLAVDTSGSLVETGGGLLEVMRDGIIDFVQKNEARFGENVRIGLVNWDDDIDETVNLTTDYDEIKKACGNFSGNLQEFTLYQEGLNGSIEVFNRSPREYVKKIIVFVTDAKGEYRNITKFPDPKEYTIHSITIGPTQNEEIANMLGNLTSQYEGESGSINESSDELEKALTTLTVSSIERRTLKNVAVVETLPKYLRALNESYSIPPTSVQINQDGINWSTETIVWDIGELSSDKCWENTFQAVFCCWMPVDETYLVSVPKKTSEVTYTDPTNSSITKHLLIPEGGIWIQPRPWWERVPVWLWALLGTMAIAIIALAIYCFRRTPKQET